MPLRQVVHIRVARFSTDWTKHKSVTKALDESHRAASGPPASSANARPAAQRAKNRPYKKMKDALLCSKMQG
jgi:hypothetical protein